MSSTIIENGFSGDCLYFGDDIYKMLLPAVKLLCREADSFPFVRSVLELLRANLLWELFLYMK
jgi:hypothetical protein